MMEKNTLNRLCILSHYMCLVNILDNFFDEISPFLYKHLALFSEIKYNKRMLSRFNLIS